MERELPNSIKYYKSISINNLIAYLDMQTMLQKSNKDFYLDNLK